MQSSNTEKRAETRMLAAIALTCYVTTLAGLLALGYSVFSLAACALDESIFAAYSRQIF
ncbi:MAG TPA: hypothetical protein VF527_15430 [Pyrinomonadaceae bacterium]|jgi:hypothetical protein